MVPIFFPPLGDSPHSQGAAFSLPTPLLFDRFQNLGLTDPLHCDDSRWGKLITRRITTISSAGRQSPPWRLILLVRIIGNNSDDESLPISAWESSRVTV
jgi:hypothetical protein